MMQPDDALPLDLGTLARPFFIGAGRVALRRDGTWRVGATRLVVRRAGAVGGPGEERPWSPAAGQTPEVVWERDEGAFAPVTDPAEVADLDARAARRRRLDPWPW